MAEIRPLVPGRLTADGFAPFGVVPGDEGAPGPTADLEFTLDDGWVNFISHRSDEAERSGRGLRCDHLNRHDTHTQTLMPVDADAVLVVAPREVRFDVASDLDAVRAFTLGRLDVVHLYRGTWHWGPFPVGADRVRLLNVQGRGWPRDNTVADLAGLGAIFEVTAPVTAPAPAPTPQVPKLS